VRAPKKIFSKIGQLIRQSDTLLVRQFAPLAALHLGDKRALNRVGAGLVFRFASLAISLLFFGGGEGHHWTLAR